MFKNLNERIMSITNFEQKERTYIGRIFASLFNWYVLYIIFLVFVGGIFTEELTWTIIVCLGVFLYIVLGFSAKNVFYLKKVEFDADKKIVKLIILRFNQIIVNTSFPINEIKFELFERRFMYKSFYLIINHKNQQIIKQPSVGGWRKKWFEDITKEYDRLKSTNN